jgi:hypothetical protein
MPAISLPWLGIGVAVVVLLLIAGFLLRGKVFSGGGAVAETLVEAEQLARQGQLQEAVQLLQSLQGQAEGEQANQVNQRVLEYQRRIKAKAAPQPVADSKIVADALASGRRVRAMRLLRDGLAKIPGDPELLKLQAEITSYSPTLPALADAVATRGWDNIRNLAARLLKDHPDDPEAQQIWLGQPSTPRSCSCEVSGGAGTRPARGTPRRAPIPRLAPRGACRLLPGRPTRATRSSWRTSSYGRWVMPPHAPRANWTFPVWEHAQERPRIARIDAFNRPTSFGRLGASGSARSPTSAS